MKVYIAGSSSESEIQRVRRAEDRLRRHGIAVVSTWPDVVSEHGMNPREASRLERMQWSRKDLDEVHGSDVLLVLVPPPQVTTRGAWVELGFALAHGTIVICAGDTKQSIFCSLGSEHSSDAAAIAHVVRLAGGAAT